MNIKLNPSQLLQAAVLALTTWLFTTVQELTTQLAGINASLVGLSAELNMLESEFTDLLIRMGG